MEAYLAVVKPITIVLSLLLALLPLHFTFFAIAGIFKRKTYPHSDIKLKYGIIIPARNEEAVVGNLVESVKRNRYPEENLQVFVIAHNCTDRTAEVARKAGATVYEYNNPNECTMGYAFHYLFDRIREDWGVENYDGFFLFNADNILAENYFEKMNDAFVACGKKNVITSFRNSKNFGSNAISASYGLYFLYGARFESRGRTAFGCSTRVQGTGYVIPSGIVKNGWPYVTLTEDWEFTADRVLLGERIEFCDEAVFYDEQPTGVRVMLRQRLRWARGHFLVFWTRVADLFKALFRSKKRGGNANKGSTYDILVNCLPYCLMSAFSTLLTLVLLHLVPICIDPQAAWPFIADRLIRFGLYTAGGYLVLVFSAALMYFLERKRISGVSAGLKVLSTFLWPVFLMLSAPLEIVAVFAKNLGWKPIPHQDTTTHADLNRHSDGSEEKGKMKILKGDFAQTRKKNAV